MSLLLWYELPPYTGIFFCPSIWSWLEDVVRHDIVIAKRRNYWYDEIVCGISIVGPVLFPKDLLKLGHEHFVQ